MSVKKSVFTSLLAVGIVNIPMLAQANSLFITNNTNEYSTTIVKRAVRLCSTSVLGSNGITNPGEQNHEISDGNLHIACYKTEEHCVAEVYMTNNCTGPEVAEVTFSLTKGIGNGDISMKDNRYNIIADGPFRIRMEYRK